jgi:hypothetical protein
MGGTIRARRRRRRRRSTSSSPRGSSALHDNGSSLLRITTASPSYCRKPKVSRSAHHPPPLATVCTSRVAVASPYRRWPRLSPEHHHTRLGRLGRSGIAHLGPENAESGTTRDVPTMAIPRRGEVKTPWCKHDRGRSKGSNRFTLARDTPCTP